MTDTTHEEPERIVPSCVEALESYHQADMDGIMVLVSRQAIHETIDAYWARVETCKELEAKLAQAVKLVEERIAFAEAQISDLKSATGSVAAKNVWLGRFVEAEQISAFLATIQQEGETDER